MIIFDRVTKRYPDGTMAVAELDLHVAAGTIMVLLGPSGCGKTTTLRMINRLIEPTTGRILLDGRDIIAGEPGPSCGGASATSSSRLGCSRIALWKTTSRPYPLLNGWSRTRSRARARELLDLVGLDAGMARRYPQQLSGGQQQRVGVARALAADPPVLLMDEPFSAVDPIVRTILQDELLRLQGELRKTIVMVTHDVEEAIKVGDVVAVFKPGGHLAQVDTPQRLLEAPADDYVEALIGFDRGIRRLSFFSAGGLDLDLDAILDADATVDEARAVMARHEQSWLLVTDGENRPQGWLATAQVASSPGTSRLGETELIPLGHTFRPAQDSLRAALDATVLSRTGRAVGVDADGRVVGVTSYSQLSEAIRAAQEAPAEAGDRALAGSA